MIENRMRRMIHPSTWEQVKTAHASGIGLREIARNMGLAEGTVLARAKREGWTHQIQSVKQQSSARAAVSITPSDAAAVTMQQRAERHVEGIAGVTDKVLPHLESMEPAAILDGIHEIEKYDRMARRNFGLSDGRPTGGPIQLHILTNQAAIVVPSNAP